MNNAIAEWAIMFLETMHSIAKEKEGTRSVRASKIEKEAREKIQRGDVSFEDLQKWSDEAKKLHARIIVSETV